MEAGDTQRRYACSPRGLPSFWQARLSRVDEHFAKNALANGPEYQEGA